MPSEVSKVLVKSGVAIVLVTTFSIEKGTEKQIKRFWPNNRLS